MSCKEQHRFGAQGYLSRAYAFDPLQRIEFSVDGSSKHSHKTNYYDSVCIEMDTKCNAHPKENARDVCSLYYYY